VTKEQLKFIHILRRKKFQADQDYRNFLVDNFDVESTKQLSVSEADECIKLLKGEETPERKYFGAGNKGSQRFLTQKQADRIEALETLLEWDTDQTRGLIERNTKAKKSVDMLFGYEASQLIIAMQKILAEGDEEVYKELNITPLNDLLKGTIRNAENRS
jgi:hypothetical protein